VHVCRSERRVEGAHLIEDTAYAPDVALRVVGPVFPDLGACVVGSSSLRLEHAPFGYLGDVQISQLDFSLLSEE